LLPQNEPQSAARFIIFSAVHLAGGPMMEALVKELAGGLPDAAQVAHILCALSRRRCSGR
jgi:hypothetical protein